MNAANAVNSNETEIFNREEVVVEIIDSRITEEMVKYQTDGALAIDLRAAIETRILVNPGEVVMIGTGLKVAPVHKNVGSVILPRSGLGHKHGIILGNTVGLIDNDYRGELKISVWNRSDQPFTIVPMDRIAQLAFVPFIKAAITFDKVDETARGENGFNSTGTK